MVDDAIGTVKLLLNSYFTKTKRPNINLLELDNQNVNEYVLNLREQDSYRNLVNNYFAGMILNYTNSKLYSTLYFNSMALHSSASLINEINSIYLIMLTNDSSRSITTYNKPLEASQYLNNANYYDEFIGCLDVLPSSLISFLNSVIFAFFISILIMHLSRERCNGSKQLQMLSGLHYVTYWISNYLFDLLICLFNIVLMVIVLKIVASIQNDPSTELYALAGDGNTLGYFMLLLMFSSLAWCTYAYVWSFLFSTDILGFVISFIIFGLIGFLDLVGAYLRLLVQVKPVQQNTDNNTNTFINVAVETIQMIFAIFFPNVTIKRAIYDLKIRNNSFCITQVNILLYCKLTMFIILLHKNDHIDYF